MSLLEESLVELEQKVDEATTVDAHHLRAIELENRYADLTECWRWNDNVVLRVSGGGDLLLPGKGKMAVDDSIWCAVINKDCMVDHMFLFWLFPAEAQFVLYLGTSV